MILRFLVFAPAKIHGKNIFKSPLKYVGIVFLFIF